MSEQPAANACLFPLVILSGALGSNELISVNFAVAENDPVKYDEF